MCSLSTLTPSCIGLGNPANEFKSLATLNPTNFNLVCSRKFSRSFCLTLDFQGRDLLMITGGAGAGCTGEPGRGVPGELSSPSCADWPGVSSSSSVSANGSNESYKCITSTD